MSVLSDLDALILRSATHPPLATKGSELTYLEWDAHTTAIYDAIQSIVSGANVTAYDASTTYNDGSTDVYLKYAGYDSRAWKAIGTFSGQTPAEGVYWTQVTLAELMPDVLKLAEVSSGGGVVVKEASLTIATADVLKLNATPIEIIAAPGAGFAIEVLSASIRVVFNTTAYATNTGISLMAATTTEQQTDSEINQTANAFTQFEPNSGAPDEVQIVENQPIRVFVQSGNPTAGDSDIKIYVTYRIITL